MRFKEIFKNKKGFALPMVIITFTVVSILGLAILPAATSENRLTRMDSRNQSTYYIAESGVHYAINEIEKAIEGYVEEGPTVGEFFDKFDKDFVIKEHEFKEFEENFNENPEVLITVKHTKTEDNTREYEIESVGKIGNSSRTVSSSISIEYTEPVAALPEVSGDIVLQTDRFTFNAAKFNAQGKTMVIETNGNVQGNANFKVKNIYFGKTHNGIIPPSIWDSNESDPINVYVEANSGSISGGHKVIYGNVHTAGDFKIEGSAKIKGNLYIAGDLRTGASTIEGNVYVAGDITAEYGTINGDVYVDGDAKINGATINGNFNLAGNLTTNGGTIKGEVHVGSNASMQGLSVNRAMNINGDLLIPGNWLPTFKNKAYYTGTLIERGNSVSNAFKVDSVPPLKQHNHNFNFTVPVAATVTLREDSWYQKNNYKRGNNFDNIKLLDEENKNILVERYNSEVWPWQNGGVLSDAVIISKGNINIGELKDFTGVLISLEGSVTVQTNDNFTGVIIAKKGVELKGGSSTYNLQSLEEYFGSKENIPVIVEGSSSGGNGGGGQGSIPAEASVTIKSSIKEL